MSKVLTTRQREVLKYLYQSIRGRGASPTIREICSRFKISSPGSAHKHLRALEAKGFLSLSGLHRGVELDRFKCDQLFGIPVLSHISAGKPRVGDDELHETLTPEDLFPSEEGLVGVRVTGDSMAGAGILPGDICLVRKQGQAQPGEIIVAVNEEGEATIKRLAKRRGRLYLDPANEKYEPIELNGGRIFGKVIKVFRDL